MNDYPSWIEPADYHIAFFAQMRCAGHRYNSCDAFGSEWPFGSIVKEEFETIKKVLTDIHFAKPCGERDVITINGYEKCSYTAFIRLTYDKFRLIRTILPLPIANEIWTHFAPAFVKRVCVE